MPRRSNNTAKAKRDHRLPEARVSAEELAIIKRKARDAGLTQSEYQRQALLEGAVIVRGNAIDAQAVKQLSAIGNNVNQIARQLNSLRHMYPVGLDTDLDQLRGISATLEQLLDELV